MALHLYRHWLNAAKPLASGCISSEVFTYTIVDKWVNRTAELRVTGRWP